LGVRRLQEPAAFEDFELVLAIGEPERRGLARPTDGRFGRHLAERRLRRRTPGEIGADAVRSPFGDMVVERRAAIVADAGTGHRHLGGPTHEAPRPRRPVEAKLTHQASVPTTTRAK